MQQVSLQGLWGKVAAWEETRQRKAWARPAWTPRFELGQITHDTLEVVTLSSVGEIHEESLQMRHCADQYAARCEAGSYIMLSVRRKDTGKRLATVGVELKADGPELHQMAGFANALVPVEVRAFALAAVECMRQQAQRQSRGSSRRRRAEGDAIRRAVPAVPRSPVTENIDKETT